MINGVIFELVRDSQRFSNSSLMPISITFEISNVISSALSLEMLLKKALLHIHGVRSMSNIVNVCTWIQYNNLLH